MGIDIMIRRVEAKAKLSQNRPTADIDGVICGLQARGDSASAGRSPRRPKAALIRLLKRSNHHGSAAGHSLRRAKGSRKPR